MSNNMLVTIKKVDSKLPLVICLPNFLLTNKYFYRKLVSDGKINLSDQTLNIIAGAINDYIAKHGHFTLVELKSSDNTMISVRL
ncbi:MAG: hypothetical protein ACI4WG_04585 [Erysipelotrichaceae bacterium]